MSIDIAASLNERQRDALLSYYLGQYIPNSGDETLISLVQTPEDVYEYLLIDPLVSNAVPTSRVAQAMSSIQQYINGITMNMEPGYQTQRLDPNAVSDWKNGLSQYDVWAGEVELDTYPENYIDPTQRQSQTAYFKGLITDLNQNTINSNTAQQAVMNYLNRFEQVANLTIVSGYIDGTDQTQDMYYLLGKSTSTPAQYYWRSFDMSQNVDNVVSTNAWSEWTPMNTTINEEALQGAPRLARFNNRLYLFWFERATAGSDSDGTTWDAITAYSSYCDFSNTWSPSWALMSVNENDAYCGQLFSTTWPCTACFNDQNTSQLTISLYSGTTTDVNNNEVDNNTADSPAGYHDFSLRIDYWFNFEQVESVTAPDSPTGTPLAQYLWHQLANNTHPNAQKQIQTAFNLGNLQVVSVAKSDSSQDDLYGITALPVLNTSDFTPTGSDTTDWSVTGSITQSTTPNASCYQVPIYDARLSGIGTATFTYDPSTLHVANITMYQTAGHPSLTFYYEVIYGDDAPYDYKYWTYPTANVLSSPGEFHLMANQNLSSSSATISIILANSTDIAHDFTACVQTWPISPDSWGTEITTPWTFQVWEGQSKSCWQTGTRLVNVQKESFSTSDTPQTFTFSDFTDVETGAGFAIRYISFGYFASSGETCYQEYQIDVKLQTDIPGSPTITSSVVTDNGSAVWLNFGSTTFSDGTTVQSIRLNTLFAKELINKATASMQALLNWDTQLTLEPPMSSDGSGNATPMDFSGANGIYFWELFFYMPYLVAWRLNQEQQYSNALVWYQYIFDPSARGRNNSSAIRMQYPEPDYWNVRPLVEHPTTGAQAAAVWLTTDPDALASASPVHYQKSVFMAYVSTLMAAGDASYRLLTSDGLALARLQYGQVKDLLGPRPDALIVNHWEPESLQYLDNNAANSIALTGFELQTSALPAFPGQSSAADAPTTSGSFMSPINTQLLGYWNTLDSRLYNLRHQLTIDGQPMSVPLYAPPVNPTLLMEQNVHGGSLISASSGMVATVPPFRFATMLQSARSAVATLSQFGQTLLSYCERQDAAGLQELDTLLAFNISGYTLTLQQNAIDAMDKDRDALQVSQTMSQQRRDHYQNLYTSGVSSSEQNAMDKLTTAANDINASVGLLTAGAAMNMAPNIFGLADGGDVWGAAVAASGLASQTAAQSTATAAQRIQISEEYRRRSEEWQIQYQQAQTEMDVINAQLDALAVRRAGAVTALQLAQAQQDKLKSTLNFLTTRFTQSALYNWLTGQLSALYYQAYDVTLSLCLSAQACWQYETGDIISRFIQTGTWNDNYRGLLVGETLQLNLQQMESAWLNRYTRRLELTRTVSLKNLTDSAGTPQINWTAFTTGTSAGSAIFSLSESLFDNDYPGHYLRQIKSVTVSLPALVGPYQDVRMTLTQSGSRVLLKPDINGVTYLNDPTKGSATSVLTNPRASQQVAVSSGLNDAGLFVLNFGDERYLPFEGTGVVSDWQIAFPNPTSAEQKALLASLNDVIVQVHYTAMYGGSSFEQAVTGTL